MKQRKLINIIKELNSQPVDWNQLKVQIRQIAGNLIKKITEPQDEDEFADSLEILQILKTIVNDIIKPIEGLKTEKPPSEEDLVKFTPTDE